MLRVALTGGIATGKSYVARRLAGAAVPLVDADVLAREAVAPGSPGLEAVRARFGDPILASDGSLDRKALAAIVFSDPGARHDLEAIVHPLVRAATDAFFDALPARTDLAVADIPLLYETGRDGDFDAVIVAACPRDLQRARVVARDRASGEDAERRIDAQWPIAEKARRADYVIDTSGTFPETDQQVDAVLEALRARARRP